MNSIELQTGRERTDHEQALMILRVLHRQWWIVCLGCFSCVLLGCWALYYTWQPEYALCWLWLTCVVFAYVFGSLRAVLSFNHRKDETTLFSTFGVGTLLTICRGVLISMLAGFLFLPWHELIENRSWVIWAPGTLYLLVGCADYFDGYFARITNHVTQLGEIFDTRMDALGILIASFVAISAGRLPRYYAAVGVAYYVLHLGIWLRRKRGNPVVTVQPYPEARILAGVQMGFLGVALLPVFAPPVMTIAAIIFMTPFLLGFVRDWLVISGRMRQGSV